MRENEAVEKDQTNTYLTIKDCAYCEEWGAIFCDRENDVYCPDCGSLIIPAKQRNNQTSPVKLQFQTICNPEWRDFPVVPTVDNFNNGLPAEFMHRYYSSDYIAWEEDMQKFIDDELSIEEIQERKYDITSKKEAEEEMKRLRQIIFNETMEDFFADLVAGKIKFRQVQTTL